VSQSDVANELGRLDKEVRACDRCDLHIGTTNGVPGEGPNDSEIMFVGEAPGFNEDKQGRPFVGAAGKFLEELLAVAGLQRGDVYITNVVKHRPPNNRDPLPAELTACRPYLELQIELINPRVIVTLGRYSLGTFLPGAMISKVHGQLEERQGRYIFPMYHPAAALHQEKLRQTLLDDMKNLAEFLQGPYKQAETAGRSAPEDEDPPEQLNLF
jgi:uracil-DNA glycosylase family 4